MRPILRAMALILVLLALVSPLMTYAAEPCPDDPVGSANCNSEAPPWYVVINRSEEALDRPGTGCQPIILNHPECTTCTGADCDIDIQTEVCQYLPAAAGDILYVLCCNCASDPAGSWMFRTYELDGAGGCTVADEGWNAGLPPGTGIDLPAPVIIGGLAVLGLGLLAVGMVMRRRTVSAA